MKHIFTLFVLVTFLISCEEVPDPVFGCTDQEAENYNANATDSDNSCVYAREAFLGDYTGTITCSGIIPDPSAFSMSISEGLTGNNDVIIEIKDTPVPFPIVDGAARNDSLLIPESTYKLELFEELRDVDISGNGVFQDNETTLSGLLKLQTEVSGVPLTSNCVFTAEK